MPKHRNTACAIVSEDETGHWVARSGGRPLCTADDPAAAILRALYGDDPAGAVLLLPPRDSRRGIR
jgi:hypothetical protein